MICHSSILTDTMVNTEHWNYVSNAIRDLSGYTEIERPELASRQGNDYDQWRINSIPNLFEEKFTRVISNIAKQSVHKNGGIIYLKIMSIITYAEQFDIILTTVVENITDNLLSKKPKLRFINFDGLTNLPNRLLLKEKLKGSLENSEHNKKEVAVLIIDLDRFAIINDSFGIDVGDLSLLRVGERILGLLNASSLLARLGGDEFVIVALDFEDVDELVALAKSVLDVISHPMVHQEYELTLSASIGISLYKSDGLDCSALLRNADTAMHNAKALGGNQFRFYNSDMNSRALDMLRIENGLRSALQKDEFKLLYQPQMNLKSGELVGVEALIRWRPKEEDVILPSDFISIAEETGLIVPIGEWTLRTACKQLVSWGNDGYSDLKMTVNLSARQFKEPGLDMMISRVLYETKCDPKKLELEIAESVIMDDPKVGEEILKKLSNMGIQLSIDDFGTGHSSLNYLKRFPIQSLKIDRSFISEIPHDDSAATIASAIIALAHNMNLTVVAEGVETAEQLAFLDFHNCDFMQGYYYSKPLDASYLKEFLQDWHFLADVAHSDLMSVHT